VECDDAGAESLDLAQRETVRIEVLEYWSTICPATQNFSSICTTVFNARDMEAALATMYRDVVWANGLEGGHVYGHDSVRDYWTRQWAMMDSRAEPTGFSIGEDGTAYVEIHLTARDLNGNPLFDEKAGHVSRSRMA
jgi:SnoaL-like domain